MMGYGASDLRHKIIIQQHAEDTIDDNGNPIQSWEPISSKPIWAAKRGLTGRMFYAAAAAHAEDNLLFVVRYSAITKVITASMRIVEGTHIYSIAAPPTDVGDMHQWLEIRAKEVV